MPCMYCEELDGKCCYPYYGLAPHTHDLKKTGTFLFSTVLDPKETWPDNFKEDKDAPGCGVYTHCPECGDSVKGD
jgi:hypothetical protein